MVFNLIVIAIGVGVGGYLLWAYYHGQISAAALALRHREMLLLGHFTDTFVDADAEMLHANPYRASVRDLYGISHAIPAVLAHSRLRLHRAARPRLRSDRTRGITPGVVTDRHRLFWARRWAVMRYESSF